MFGPINVIQAFRRPLLSCHNVTHDHIYPAVRWLYPDI